jgi:hypothetical protein
VTDAIRRLRFELGRALAVAEDERFHEALEELDRALAEPAADPPDADIHLAAGGLLEDVDAAGAMVRYLQAIDGPSCKEAAGRALALLERTDIPGTLLSPVPDQLVERVHRIARESTVGECSLLAAALLRDRRRDGDAAELLMRGYDNALEPRLALTARLVESLLDLNRMDEALKILGGAPDEPDDWTLVVPHAQARLMRGEPQAALDALDALPETDAQRPAAAAVAALALIGLEDVESARERLSDADSQELHYARAILHLSAREYAAAQEASWALVQARPNDTEALLVNAQPLFEGLGETEMYSAPGSPAFDSSDIGAARSLLADLAHDLDHDGPQSRWWRMQYAVRQDDPRFRFFDVELRRAVRAPLSIDELDEVDSAQTTWQQDSAVAELRAMLLDDDGKHDAAAEAYDEAAHLAGDLVGDERSAATLAQKAYDQMPTADRAAELAERANSATLGMGPDEAHDLVVAALEAARKAFEGAEDDGTMQRLVHAIAWLYIRVTENADEFRRSERLEALPWVLAGLTTQPDDSVLRAFLSFTLTELDCLAGAHASAARAYARDPENAYVAEAAVVALTNFTGTPDEVHAVLAGQPTLTEQGDWVNAIDLSIYAGLGDRDAIRERLGHPGLTGPWDPRNRALGAALVDGMPEAADELRAVLDDKEADAPASYTAAALLAAAVRDRVTLESIAQAAAGSPDLVRQKREWIALVQRFVSDSGVTADAFVADALPLCRAPAEVLLTVNVALPILEAARSRVSGPAPSVPVDMGLVGRRIDQLEAELPAWPDELEALSPGLGPLARLADPEGYGLAELVAAQDDVGRLEHPELAGRLQRLSRLAVAEAAANVPRAVVEAAIGRRPPVKDGDVHVALEGGFELPAGARTAVTLLVDAPGGAEPTGTAAEVISFMSGIAHEAPLDADGWWGLDDALERTTARGPELVATVRAEMVDVLAETLGFGAVYSRPEQRRQLKFSIGADLIPTDPGPDWRMFDELLPGLRQRIQQETGVTLPPCTVTPEFHRHEGLRLFIHDAPLRGLTIPTHGWIVPDEHGELQDPLTGRAARVVEGAIRPPDGWDPLEFAMRHVERFCRDHLAEVITVWDVSMSASRAGPDVADRVTGDARLLLEWLAALRGAIMRGERREPAEIANELGLGPLLAATPAATPWSGY